MGERAEDMRMTARRRWMGLLARADGSELDRLAGETVAGAAHAFLRRPEPGLVMVRARAGGVGAPFNFGEMTVTRCAVRIRGGAEGHAYVAGRDTRKAHLAAVIDGLMQDAARAAEIEAAVIAPLERAERACREARARKAAATRVDFFTMVRSEA